MKILIVEDNKTIAEYLQEVLSKEAYRTIIASTAAEAEQLLSEQEFNLVLLDLYLPDKLGTTILQEIREKKSQSELPVIVISTTNKEQEIIEILNKGANDFVSKPINLITLKIKIKNLLRLQQTNSILKRQYVHQKQLLQQQKTIFENAPYASFIIGENHQIKEMNKAAEYFTGSNSQFNKNLCCGDVFSCSKVFKNKENCGENTDCKTCILNSSIRKTFQTEEAVFKKTGTITITNNTETKTMWVVISTVLLTSENEKNVLLTVEDITQQKINDETIRLKNKELNSINKKLLEETEKQKNTEKALRKQEEYLRSVFNSMSEMLFVVNQDGFFTNYNNPEATDIDFSTPNLYLNKTYKDVLPSFITQQIDKAIERIKQTNEIQEIECPLVINKKENWFNARLSALRNENEQFAGITATVRNITTQKLAEKAIKESEEKYRTLVSSMPIGVIMHNTALEVIAANPQAAKILGVTYDELMGKTPNSTIWKTVHEDFSPFPAETHPVSITIKTGNKQENVIMGVVQNNNAIVWISINSEPIFFENTNKIRACIVTIADITDLKKTMTELKDSQLRYKQLFDFLPVGISVADNNGNLINSNHEAERILNIPKSIHDNKTIDDTSWAIIDKDGQIMPPEKFASVRALKEKKLIENVEMGIMKNNTSVTWINVTAVPNVSGEGVIISYIDITDKIEKEKKLIEYSEKLTELNATKDKFFSIIAHDLKNPFNNLLGFSELLLKNYHKYDDKKRLTFINHIFNTSSNSSKLLNNLLSWAQSQSGRLELFVEQFDIKIVVNDIVELFRELAAKKEISIKNNVTQNQYINADKNTVETILRNLLSNAIKFTNLKGEVIINSKIIDNIAENPLLEVEVKDNGVGIPFEKQQDILKIENAISSKGTDNETGTGLGLILCKEFAEKNNGNLYFKSIPQKGSSFFVSLPYSPQEPTENKIEILKSNSATEILENEIKNNPKFVNFIKNSLFVKCHNAINMYSIESIQEVINQLLFASKEFSSPFFKDLHAEIRNDFENFNISKIVEKCEWIKNFSEKFE